MPPYELMYSRRAEASLTSLPAGLLDFVEEHLLILAAHPTSLSRPSIFPYPPNSQLFQFHHENFEGERWDFAVLFRYTQDERSLFILNIGRTRSDPSLEF